MLLPGMQAGAGHRRQRHGNYLRRLSHPLLNHGHGVDGWGMGWRVIGLIAQVAAGK